MLELILAAVLTGAPLGGLQAVRERLAAGVPPAAVAEEIAASGLYVGLTPDEVVRLYFAGVPVPVLTALLRVAGPEPRLTAADGGIELGYAAYRILGRSGPDGPRLIVTGYDAVGERLQPAIEPLPVPVRPEPAPAEPVFIADSAAVREPAPIRIEVRAAPPPPPPTLPGYGYVSISRIPPAYRGHTFVWPSDAPAFGLATYGYGQPFYGAYAEHLRAVRRSHRSAHHGHRHSSFAQAGYHRQNR